MGLGVMRPKEYYQRAPFPDDGARRFWIIKIYSSTPSFLSLSEGTNEAFMRNINL